MLEMDLDVKNINQPVQMFVTVFKELVSNINCIVWLRER